MAQIQFILISIYNLKFKDISIIHCMFSHITIIIMTVLLTIIIKSMNNDKTIASITGARYNFFQVNFFSNIFNSHN